VTRLQIVREIMLSTGTATPNKTATEVKQKRNTERLENKHAEPI